MWTISQLRDFFDVVEALTFRFPKFTTEVRVLQPESEQSSSYKHMLLLRDRQDSREQ